MSTPTAIEIVREMQLWRRGEGKYDYNVDPHGPSHECLASELNVWVNQSRPELGQKPKDTQ